MEINMPTSKQTPVPSIILIKSARIFDGKSPKLIEGMSVLIEDNKIARIDKNVVAPRGSLIINAGGKTLMPGLIDAHWHSMFSNLSLARLLQSDVSYMSLVAAKGASETLMRGFTTVRDLGGNCFAVKKATDECMIMGPRIYPSGPPISQTSGHFDFRGPNDVPSNPGDPLPYLERNACILVADGVPEVIKRAREVLRMGATQIKLAAGGGASSLYDPIDVVQFTLEEMRAAVDIAKTWNTYVAVHVYTDKGTRQVVEAGVTSIEHGFMLEEETFKLIAEGGVWLSIQPIFNDEDAITFADPISTAKFIQVTEGTKKSIEMAKRYGVKLAFGTDILFAPSLCAKQGKFLTKFKPWFSPYEILKMATSVNAELIKLCGPRDPYPGELGIVAEGALADLLLVDGNPLENIDLVKDPDKKFMLIVKDGKIYKNLLG
jgi:imidazolonepropionase-like amidohydrolase